MSIIIWYELKIWFPLLCSTWMEFGKNYFFNAHVRTRSLFMTPSSVIPFNYKTGSPRRGGLLTPQPGLHGEPPHHPPLRSLWDHHQLYSYWWALNFILIGERSTLFLLVSAYIFTGDSLINFILIGEYYIFTGASRINFILIGEYLNLYWCFLNFVLTGEIYGSLVLFSEYFHLHFYLWAFDQTHFY